MRVRFFFFGVFLILAGALPRGANAQSTIFVSRHADREAPEPDPPLTAKGRCQAEALAGLLADAKIKHIYTTELIRTQQTAAPTARLSGVTPVVVAQTDFDGLIAHVRATAKAGESTLVVGHRGTVPRIVKALSGQDIPPLASDEYTRLIAVTLFPDGRASVVTLRQGGKCGP
jgi:broad specificity phosphatase PhoE